MSKRNYPQEGEEEEDSQEIRRAEKRQHVEGEFSQTESEPDTAEEQEAALQNDPERLISIQKINRLYNRFQTRGVQLRSSAACLEQLGHLDAQQLDSVYDNLITDISHIRGTPTASAALIPLRYLADPYIPGYYKECREDAELKMDIESEFVSLFGLLGNKANILCRLVINAGKCLDPELRQEEPPLLPEQEAPDPSAPVSVIEDHETTIGGVDSGKSGGAKSGKSGTKKKKQDKQQSTTKSTGHTKR